MKKTIIFFDGDGTLWYPKKTRHTKAPHWIYQLPGGHKVHNAQLTLIPQVMKTLKNLKKKGVITILLSTHPQGAEEAKHILSKKVRKFKLATLFDEVHATPLKPEAKGEYIIQILRQRKIPKSKALMIGDTYEWDYLSAKKQRIDARLIKTAYMQGSKRTKTITNITELLL
jgi:magnesium-dependent phosphatase-1